MEYLVRLKTILQLKRYSSNTIKTYLGLLKAFIGEYMLTGKQLAGAREKQLLPLLIDYNNKKNYSYTSQKQLIAAVKILYAEVFKTKLNLSAIYPTQRPQPLPNILSKNEIKALLKNTPNLKHRAMLTAIYAMGLRSSELLNLKLKSIDSDRMMVSVKASKGKKDRVVMLSSKLLSVLREYFKEYQPKEYLFEGQNGGKYSTTSLQKVFNRAKTRAKIKKHVTLHTLRHSFATHLLEGGTDIRIIQKLLGHTNIHTTLIYTKVSNKVIGKVRSPLDDFD